MKLCTTLACCFAFTSLAQAEAPYRPTIEPSQFTAKVTHPLFGLTVGKTFVFEGQTADGLEREEVTVVGETRKIMGVETQQVLVSSSINGEVVEVTKDFYAQDAAGNVWYFGEAVDNLKGGKLVNHQGTWIAGVKGAQPGILLHAQPVAGKAYRSEFAKGEAEDMGRVMTTDETVKTKAGVFEGCRKIFEWTPLEPDLKELKYYCPGVAGQVLTENLDNGDRLELISVRAAK